MGDIGYVASALNGEGQRNYDQNRYKIFGLELDGERDHQDFVLAEDDSESDQNREHAA